MKLKLQHILLTFCLAFCGPACLLYAQDTYSNAETETESETKGRPHYGPGGDIEVSASSSSTHNTQPTVLRDSATDTPSIAYPGGHKGVAKPKDEDDDSVLSFNFLYYIIRKYKLQDIMD